MRTAKLVSRALVAAGGAGVNAERVYRILKAQGWLLACYTAKSTQAPSAQSDTKGVAETVKRK